MELIQKGLNNYLEEKRLYFNRFFFLSNDELLEILSETKDPTRVQPHLKKCFEGIAKLNFNEKLEILAMISSEKEEIAFEEKIDPALARGMVEKWLLQVEESMLKNIRRVSLAGTEDYAFTKRTEWVHPVATTSRPPRQPCRRRPGTAAAPSPPPAAQPCRRHHHQPAQCCHLHQPATAAALSPSPPPAGAALSPPPAGHRGRPVAGHPPRQPSRRRRPPRQRSHARTLGAGNAIVARQETMVGFAGKPPKPASR